MWENIKKLILKLFGSVPIESRKGFDAERDARSFRDTERVNFTAIFANALSTLAFSDSAVSVKGSEFLNSFALEQWKTIKSDIAVGNGIGMLVSIPYTVEGGKKIAVDTITKERFFITAATGREITAITALSDAFEKEGKSYKRFTDYSVKNGVYVIRQKAVCGTEEIPLESVKQWAKIPKKIEIEGCERLPIGIYRCPAGGRTTGGSEGFPITHGCGETIGKIHRCLRQIEREFDRKEVKIFADTSLFNRDEKLTDVYKTIRTGGTLTSGQQIEVFDPPFRDNSLYNRLQFLFAQLEKEVGTGRGILTDLSVSGGTATEIRRAMYSTFSLCDDIHLAAQEYFDGLLYGVSLLAKLYKIDSCKNYTVDYDWSYSMLEDSGETFSQFIAAQSIGAVTAEEIREFLSLPKMKEQVKKEEQKESKEESKEKSKEKMKEKEGKEDE